VGSGFGEDFVGGVKVEVEKVYYRMWDPSGKLVWDNKEHLLC
jgi:hypothetical protein